MDDDDDDDDTTLKILFIAIPSVIAFCGVFSNVLSLSYFIRRENASLWSRLLMLLNSLDLAVCLSGAVTGTLIFMDSSPAYKIARIAFFFFLDGTGGAILNHFLR